MDDRISQLQSMFPSIEGDVIGVVLNESDNNGGHINFVDLRLDPTSHII